MCALKFIVVEVVIAPYFRKLKAKAIKRIPLVKTLVTEKFEQLSKGCSVILNLVGIYF